MIRLPGAALIVLTLIIGLFLAGCSGGNPTPVSSTPASPSLSPSAPGPMPSASNPSLTATPSSSKLRLALVTFSPANDLSWSESMVVAAKALQAELAGQLELQISDGLTDPKKAELAIRSYAEQGFDLIVAHGSQYSEAVLSLAREFPASTFACGISSRTATGVYAYQPRAEQGAFLLGFLAGSLSHSKIVGFVGGNPLGDSLIFAGGFRQGVALADPQVTLLESSTSSFDDYAGAEELARAQIEQGADILSGTAQQSSGALQAVADKGLGAYWMANAMDQSELAPQQVLAAQVYRWEGMLRQLVDSCLAGKRGQTPLSSKQGELLVLDFKNGGLELVFNPNLESAIPPEIKAKVEQLRTEIASGRRVIALTP